MIEIRKKEGESPNSALFRFTKRVRQSGVLVEMRKRRFKGRAVNKRSRRASAIFRIAKKANLARAKKLGTA